MLAAGSIDQEIYSLIEKKRAVVNAATDGGSNDDGGAAIQLVMNLIGRYESSHS
jgi:hypothetical protein